MTRPKGGGNSTGDNRNVPAVGGSGKRGNVPAVGGSGKRGNVSTVDGSGNRGNVPAVDRSAKRKGGATTQSAALLTTSQQIERELAARALQKRKAGQMPSRQELAALRRWEQANEERQRWEIYHSIPQAHWIKMSGRQAKILNEQARRYGMPFGGAVVDLEAVVRSLHDFIAKNSRRLSGADDDEADMYSGADSPALERYRDERAKLARLERLEREGVLVRIDWVSQYTHKLAAVVRSAGDLLQRQFGAEAFAVLDDALAELKREVGQWKLVGDVYSAGDDNQPQDGERVGSRVQKGGVRRNRSGDGPAAKDDA
jgi:hypothetical protein